MQSRLLTINRKPSGNPEHPFINISCKWLNKLGFKVGGKVLVQFRNGTIHIKAINFLDLEESDLTERIKE